MSLAREPINPNEISNIVTAEELLALMDENRVERALVVQRAHVYGFNNDYVVDAAARYPNRLSAMCMIDALHDNGPEHLRYWICERGAVAGRLTEPHRGAGPEWLSSDKALRVWDVAADLCISMRLHLYAWNRDYCLPQLFEVLRRYPTVPVVVDHMTSPVPEAGPDGIDTLMIELAEHPNASVLVSTINFNRFTAAGQSTAAVVRRAVEVFGSDRVMWGSDIAQSNGDYRDMISSAHLAVAELDESGQRDVLHDTGSRFYSR